MPVVSRLGEGVTLSCEAEGDPAPRVSWHSERALRLAKEGPNYRIEDSGALVFFNVEKGDEGRYRCKAKNMYGSAQSEWADLRVEAGAEVKEWPETLRVEKGKKLELQCAATGDPAPIISWLKDGKPVSTQKPKQILIAVTIFLCSLTTSYHL